MHCDAIRYNTLRYDTFRYDTLQYFTIPYDTTYCHTIHCDSIPYHDTLYMYILWYNVIQRNNMRYSAIPQTKYISPLQTQRDTGSIVLLSMSSSLQGRWEGRRGWLILSPVLLSAPVSPIDMPSVCWHHQPWHLLPGTQSQRTKNWD